MLNPKGIFLDSNHSFKMGDSMIRTYGKKTIKFEFNFDETGENLKTIINKTYKEELYRKKILLGGANDELQKSKMMLPCNRRYFRPLSEKGGI